VKSLLAVLQEDFYHRGHREHRKDLAKPESDFQNGFVGANAIRPKP
jgi:hypothetical protein